MSNATVMANQTEHAGAQGEVHEQYTKAGQHSHRNAQYNKEELTSYSISQRRFQNKEDTRSNARGSKQ